jgi:hypothetical protein
MSAINIKEELLSFAESEGIYTNTMQFPEAEIEVDKIKVIMINEVPPLNPNDYFYSKSENPNYMSTTIPLFQNAGVNVKNILDILELGIYLTTAVKVPKSEYTFSTDLIINHLPILNHEIDMFPDLRLIMLMGDVAKRSFNLIARMKHQKTLTGSTYKIRQQEYYFNDKRVLPSYIMTGGNILIEKSKVRMISEDIIKMMEIILKKNKC